MRGDRDFSSTTTRPRINSKRVTEYFSRQLWGEERDNLREEIEELREEMSMLRLQHASDRESGAGAPERDVIKKLRLEISRHEEKNRALVDEVQALASR